ncbi:MAG: DUF1080 domain-containing protein [Armatimonadota bacterium]
MHPITDAMQDGPYNVRTLFDGSTLENFHHKDGSEPGWELNEDEGSMTVVPKTGSIISLETFTDCLLHVEFLLPDMPEAEGQAKANSGVFLQGRYEIQVLDSSEWETPGQGDCGAIYNQHAPLVNACLPPEQWQSYDIVFRAPRVEADGSVIDYPRMTVFQNGILIHNNAVLSGPTGGQLDENLAEPGPLMLQDHGDEVSFRNVWLAHLPEEVSTAYEPA